MNFFDTNTTATKVYVSIAAMFVVIGSTAADRVPANITLHVPNATVEEGEAFAVDVVTKQVPLLQSGELSLYFDPKIIAISGVVFTGAWNVLADVGDIDNEKGAVNRMRFASTSGIRGDSTIATIWFAAKAVGDSRLALVPAGPDAFTADGKYVHLATGGGSISVIPVSHSHRH